MVTNDRPAPCKTAHPLLVYECLRRGELKTHLKHYEAMVKRFHMSADHEPFQVITMKTILRNTRI